MSEDKSAQNQVQAARPVCQCPLVREQRRVARRAVLALDVFHNSTEHEEYRPS